MAYPLSPGAGDKSAMEPASQGTPGASRVPPSGGAAARLDRLYEFERAPVTPDKLLGPGYFAGSFAGEHVAATEFVIGALFVSWGANLKDIFLGLALGNLLAVLSWTLVCAPIAVQTRLTLYWYLRRACGPLFALFYNLLNALLFCVLAGCMITVSASAVRIPFGIPPQVQWYPTSPAFVALVLLVGGVVVTLAILGFKRLAAFASVCSPWMLLMFVAGALALLPVLGEKAGAGPVRSLQAFLETARKTIWTGKTPSGGPPAITFAQIAAFAWICNLAMHLGLSDLALFRFAKKSWYGLFSACGMFLGHYLAWICAGVMGAGAALLLKRPLTELDSGAVAFQALGVAGAIAVVIAGWTTSNPTLYRAGLALQAVTPNWARWKVTLAAGTATTLVACFPFVFTRLLDFVGLYGLLLSPAGAIVIAEHWILPRLGMESFWAEKGGKENNLPALLAWGGGMALALLLWTTGALHLFYLFLPVFPFTILAYILLAKVSGAGKGETPAQPAGPKKESPLPSPEPPEKPGRGKPGPDPFTWFLAGLALLSLAACLALPLAVFFADPRDYGVTFDWFQNWLILPTLVYFLSATAFALRRKQEKNAP